jgi:hypothetical protein
MTETVRIHAIFFGKGLKFAISITMAAIAFTAMFTKKQVKNVPASLANLLASSVNLKMICYRESA